MILKRYQRKDTIIPPKEIRAMENQTDCVEDFANGRGIPVAAELITRVFDGREYILSFLTLGSFPVEDRIRLKRRFPAAQYCVSTNRKVLEKRMMIG